MLRKMETGAAEETSLLEFIKSKLLAGPGEGGWGWWAMLGGQIHAKGACWESLGAQHHVWTSSSPTTA